MEHFIAICFAIVGLVLFLALDARLNHQGDADE
jgi:hypothetical protein